MSQNGKGSRPRSGFNQKYRSNFDEIKWGQNKIPLTPAKPATILRSQLREDVSNAGEEDE